MLCGFDRLVLRGELGALYIAEGGGIRQYRKSRKIWIKDFGRHVREVSERLKPASLAATLELGRIVKYLPSAAANQEEIARRIATQQQIQNGLVCVLTSVEPCRSFQVMPHRESQPLDLKREQRKCLHLYHYYMHPVLGLRNARIQTWFPFRVPACRDGREWLARQMDGVGMKYVRQDNGFPWMEDFPRASRRAGTAGRAVKDPLAGTVGAHRTAVEPDASGDL